jgi:hypothetical protein
MDNISSTKDNMATMDNISSTKDNMATMDTIFLISNCYKPEKVESLQSMP